MANPVKLGITLGDINGVGPEIALKTAYNPELPSDLQFVLVGPAKILELQARKLGYPVPPAWKPDQQDAGADRVLAWDPKPDLNPEWRIGEVDVAAGRAAYEAICAVVDACREDSLQGMVTAPINKDGFNKAGVDVPGHTELLAKLTGTKRFAMLLAGGGLRVLLVTRHVPLQSVSDNLTTDKIVESIELAREGLNWFGIEAGKIGVCGLNPHAGDGGLLGTEEREIIAPAIQSARAQGIDVDDVVPADVIFHKALRGDYDVVVSMYHDQGLGPLKMIAFDEGINVTLGLPIVRTSPDHGTAYDIAGQGIASPKSMEAAVKLAAQLARRPNPWR